MWKYLIGITAALVFGAAIQAQAAAAGEAGKPGMLLLAQKSEREEARKEAEAMQRLEQEKKRKEMHMEKSREEERLMDKSDSKSLHEPPAAAGTKRVGGQTIRGKETLEGD